MSFQSQKLKGVLQHAKTIGCVLGVCVCPCLSGCVCVCCFGGNHFQLDVNSLHGFLSWTFFGQSTQEVSKGKQKAPRCHFGGSCYIDTSRVPLFDYPQGSRVDAETQWFSTLKRQGTDSWVFPSTLGKSKSGTTHGCGSKNGTPQFPSPVNGAND